MLVAQAQQRELIIVSRDPAFGAYDMGVLAC
jgi:PIN domain nuclease of toxin-antitoxin system